MKLGVTTFNIKSKKGRNYKCITKSQNKLKDAHSPGNNIYIKHLHILYNYTECDK